MAKGRKVKFDNVETLLTLSSLPLNCNDIIAAYLIVACVTDRRSRQIVTRRANDTLIGLTA